MRKPCISLILLLSIVACSKHDDAPPAQASSGTPANPTVANPCDRGGTIVLNQNGGFGAGSTMAVHFANFLPSCGDSASVFISNPGQNAWVPVVQAPTAQPNWYTVGVGSVTIHNGSAVQQDWQISVTEK